MEPFFAWHALVTGHTFIWYIILAALIMGCFFKRWLAGYREYLGQDQADIKQWMKVVQHRQQLLERSQQARWRVNLADIVMELKHDRTWAKDLSGEALMVRAVIKALSYVQALELGDVSMEKARDLRDYIHQHRAFIPVSGQEAQAMANRNQVVMALSLPDSDREPGSAALVIPGNIYPGSVFGRNNPMVLWFEKDTAVELQAAAAFSHHHPVSYFAVKNTEQP